MAYDFSNPTSASLILRHNKTLGGDTRCRDANLKAQMSKHYEDFLVHLCDQTLALENLSLVFGSDGTEHCVNIC